MESIATTTMGTAFAGVAVPGPAGADVFRRIGECWAVRFDGVECLVRDAKGLGYLARLLGQPGREVHALDLVEPRGARCEPADDCDHDEACEDAYLVVERARLSVTRAIRRAQARLAACHPSLGRHLDTTIRTGTYCAYVPDARLPITWQVEECGAAQVL